MMVVCKDWLEKLRANRNRGVDVVAVVENDVSAILNGKSLEQLSQLQRQIQTKLASGEPIDVDYWEGLLKNLIVWKAKVCCFHNGVPMIEWLLIASQAKLKNLHEVVVRNRLEQLRKRQRDEALLAQKELLAGVAKNTSRSWGGDLRAEAIAQPTISQDVAEPEAPEPYDRSMSPTVLDIKKLPYDERQIHVISAKDDVQALVNCLFTITWTGGIFLTGFCVARVASCCCCF